MRYLNTMGQLDDSAGPEQHQVAYLLQVCMSYSMRHWELTAELSYCRRMLNGWNPMLHVDRQCACLKTWQ